MAKTKRKKSVPQPNIGRQIENIVRDAIQTSTQKHIYYNTYGVKNDETIAEIKSKLTINQKNALITWMFANIEQARKLKNIPEIGMDTLIPSKTQFRQAVKLNAAILFSTVAQPKNPLKFKEKLPLLADIEKKFPTGFYQHNQGQQTKIQILMPIYDTITLSIYGMCNWTKILPEDKEHLWGPNIMKIVQAIGFPENIQELDEQLEPITISLLHIVAENIKKESILSSNITPDPIVRHLTNQFVPIPNMPVPFNSNSLQNLQQLQKSNETADYKESFCLAFGSLSYDLFSDFQKIVNNIPYAALIYAAFHCVNGHNKLKHPTLMTEFLQLLTVEDRFSCHADFETLAQYKKHDDKIMTFSAHEKRKFPKEIIRNRNKLLKELEEKDEDTSDFSTDSTSLWYMFGATTGGYIPEHINIDMGMEDTLKALGYTEKETAALCGFMTAMDDLQHNKHLLNAFVEYDDEDNSEVEPVTQTETIADIDEIRKNIRRELEAEMQTLKSSITNELDLERKRHVKAQKQAFHAQSEAEEIAQELKAENDQLQEQIQELKKIIIDLEEKIPETTKPDEPEKTDITYDWPSDIGLTHTIVVVGGPENWVKEQERRFPNIRFYGVDTTPDQGVLSHADMIFIYTWVMKHKNYWPTANIAKKMNIPMKNIPFAGINTSSDYILQTYQELFNE